MNILIKNANLISMSENRLQYEENMDIFIKNNIIEKIQRDIPLEDNTKLIEANGKIVMPGLINTHAHIPMSIFRETIDGYGLQDWLEKKIWPMEDKLTPEDIYYATCLSCIEMIKTGCTTINDMYFMTDNIIKAVSDFGLRLQTTRTLMSGANDADERIKDLQSLLNKYKDKELITFNAGVHGLYTTNEEDLKKFIKFAKKNNLLVHMHFCENSKEVEDIKKAYNVSSTVKVIKKYFAEIPTLLAHAVKLTEEEIEEIGKLKNISISHCPVSNLKLGCGVAKIQKMVDQKINVTLGTDGQGSGSNLNMFETMKFTGLLQKGINEEPKNLPAYEILKMGTINGAKALGLSEKIGSIEKGKVADIIILNTNSELMQPINDIFSDIVYNADSSNVETTIVNGKILMENKKICYKDEEYIYSKCKDIINRINN